MVEDSKNIVTLSNIIKHTQNWWWLSSSSAAEVVAPPKTVTWHYLSVLKSTFVKVYSLQSTPQRLWLRIICWKNYTQSQKVLWPLFLILIIFMVVVFAPEPIIIWSKAKHVWAMHTVVEKPIVYNKRTNFSKMCLQHQTADPHIVSSEHCCVVCDLKLQENVIKCIVESRPGH